MSVSVPLLPRLRATQVDVPHSATAQLLAESAERLAALERPAPVTDRVVLQPADAPDINRVTRYAGLYDLFGGPREFAHTLSRVPLAGVVRALAENQGVDPRRALLLERSAAGLAAAGIGVPGLLAAADALNGNDSATVIVQQPSYR